MTYIDWEDLIRRVMEAEEREPDGKLHPSTHLDGSDRHAWLDIQRIPRQKKRFGNAARLYTGTMWHRDIMRQLQGAPAMFEVKLEPWLPEGWSGTGDIFLFVPELKRWHLTDLKSTDDVAKVETWGLKPTYRAQVASYADAASRMGLDMVDTADVVHFPIGGEGEPRTLPVEVGPLERAQARQTMVELRDRVLGYQDLPPAPPDLLHYRRTREGVTVHQQHHMSRGFCPFSPADCGCKVDSLKWWKVGTFKRRYGVLIYVDHETGQPGFPPEGADIPYVERLLDE